MIKLPSDIADFLAASTERQAECFRGGGHRLQHVTDGVDPYDDKFKQIKVCICGYVQIDEITEPTPVDYTVIPRCVGCGVYLDMPPPWRLNLGDHHSCLRPKCIRRLVREAGPEGAAMAAIIMALARTDQQ